MMFKCLLLTVWAISFAREATSNIITPCKTPYHKNGICTDIKSCPSILTMISKENLTEEETTFLKDSQCQLKVRRKDANVVYVCCPVSEEESQSNSVETRMDIPLLPDNCGNLVQDYLVRGMNTDIYDYPWLALLEYSVKDERVFGCGGVLINEQYVLTAAHCATINLVSVRLGEYDLNSTIDCTESSYAGKECNNAPQNIPVERITLHEDFNSNKQYNNDIALIRLKGKAFLDDFVHPICLPLRNDEQTRNLTNAYLTVSGWNGTNSIVKIESHLTGITNDECRLSLRVHLEDSQWCAENYHKTPNATFCTGDSGGPIMAQGLGEKRWTVYGVFSFDTKNCNRPSVYTNVSDYLFWIKDHLLP